MVGSHAANSVGYSLTTCRTQYDALQRGVDFDVYIVCNVKEPDQLEVVRIPGQSPMDSKPKVGLTDRQYAALQEDDGFDVYIVCNVWGPDQYTI